MAWGVIAGGFERRADPARHLVPWQQRAVGRIGELQRQPKLKGSHEQSGYRIREPDNGSSARNARLEERSWEDLRMQANRLGYHANCWGALGGNAVGVTSITQLTYRTFGNMERAIHDILGDEALRYARRRG